MGLLNKLFGQSRNKSNKEPKQAQLGLECLESRDLLDANSILAGTTLNITGGNNRDVISVLREQDQLVVRDSGQEVARFTSANVNLIQVFAGGGNDIVLVGPNVSQNANLFGQGGAQGFIEGGDLLSYQGMGVGTINGGTGNDALLGGPGNDILLGGADNDILFGAGGNNVLTGGTGSDTFFGDSSRDVITDFTPGTDFNRFDTPPPSIFDDPFLGLTPTPQVVISEDEVDLLLQRASAATPSRDAIIAIVDRGGRVLGVRVEDNVSTNITGNQANLIFAIDGALAQARTGAFFASNQAPLTSRTVQNLSETTNTEREVNSNPSITDPDSNLRGPGTVGPIGLGNHFPRGVAFTPQVDLFKIETTNRDSSFAIGPDNIRGTADDIALPERFNIDPNDYNPAIPLNQRLAPPDSYGVVSGLDPTAAPRGIGTLPGGAPIYKRDPDSGAFVKVGGIGVFFPGETGFASESNSALSTNFDPTKPDRALEAEYIAFAALGGLPVFGFPVGQLGGINPVQDIGILEAPGVAPRIDLVGITLDVFGPGGLKGPEVLRDLGIQLGQGVVNGQLQQLLDPGPNNKLVDIAGINGGLDNPGLDANSLLPGTPVPEGWLVLPQASTDGLISVADVQDIVLKSVQQSLETRAAIRLPFNQPASMVIAVTAKDGEILGLFRMPDSTVFSIDVSVAKARNVAYYADPDALQPEDQLPGVPAGVAFTNRTFRFAGLPRFPEGIDGAPPAPFSQLNDDPNIDRYTPLFVEPQVPGQVFIDVVGTGLQNGTPAPASQFQSVVGFDSFNPGTNFRDNRTNNVLNPLDPAFFNNTLLNRNGIVFFPGSAPLYENNALIGGFGISGDGVDQDDVVTFAGKINFDTPQSVLRSDQVVFAGVRLPYQKFNRQPNIFAVGDERNLNVVFP